MSPILVLSISYVSYVGRASDEESLDLKHDVRWLAWSSAGERNEITKTN